MNSMAHTIDDKIDQIRHEGFDRLPVQNSIDNLPTIKLIIFGTKSYGELVDEEDTLIEWANDGGTSKINSDG
jgi:hypothetical protein